MAGELCPVARSHLLTNPVAEYLETRQGAALGDTAPKRPNSDFVPEMDQFIRRGTFSDQDYHKASHAHMLEFQMTLRKFHEHMEKRKDKNKSIQLKNPSEYTFKDVLEITTRLQEDHESAGQVKTCMGLVRRLFRGAGEHSSTLERLLAFVPSDSYGSVICGGFSMILTAAQRTHELREQICEAISEIPKKLGHIHRQLRVHYKSPNLRACADAILVAIFVLLERIVGELTKSLTKKVFMATIKGSDYADEIKDAIKTLSTRVDEFDSEARICDSERLGQVEENGVRTMIAMESITEFLRQKEKDEKALHEKTRFLESQTIGYKQEGQNELALRQSVTHEGLQIAVENALYRFYMAHPNVDNRTGKPTVGTETFGFKASKMSRLQPIHQPEFMDMWLQELGQTRSDSSYIEKCLESVWDLSLREMDRIKFVMASAELRSWLRSRESTTLVIDSETRPAEVFNALTCSVAIVTHTLISEAEFPVLSFFCGLHANEEYDENASGPIGMMNCLNAQLMSYFKERNLGMMVHEQLKSPDFRRKSQVRLSKALDLLEQMFKELPENDPVVIVIDSTCRLLGSTMAAEKATGGLLRAAARANKTVKMLITSPLSTDKLRPNTFSQLFIPDYIDGDREGLNMELVQADAAEAASASKERGGISNDSDSISFSTSDSDDDWPIENFR